MSTLGDLRGARDRRAAGIEDTSTPTASVVKRQAGNFDFYQQEGNRWICKTCGSEIKAVTRYVSIWDGPGPCAGSGEVESYQEPYCSNCEVKP